MSPLGSNRKFADCREHFRDLLVATTLVAALIAPTLAGAANASAETWARPDRSVAATTTLFTGSAKEQYGATGSAFRLLDDESEGSVRSYGLMVAGEVVPLPRLTVFFETSLRSIELETPFSTVAVRGMSDFWLGAKWLLYDAPLFVSASLAGKTPTGYTADPGPFMPILGNGAPEVEARVHLWKKFDVPFYAGLEAGYRLRGSRPSRGGGPPVDYADEIPLYLELGFSPMEKLLAVGTMDAVFGLGTPAPLDRIEFAPYTQDFVRLGPGVRYQVLERLQVGASYVFTVLGKDALGWSYLLASAQAHYEL